MGLVISFSYTFIYFCKLQINNANFKIICIFLKNIFEILSENKVVILTNKKLSVNNLFKIKIKLATYEF